jgi:DNA-binding NarL/FixJ family response regulator
VTHSSVDVLIVEDQLLLLGALRVALDGFYGIRVVATASSVEAARKVTADYDVMLTDISLPGENGVQFARECKNARPELGVLLLSAHDFPAALAWLQDFPGGWGYLLKDSLTDTDEVARAIQIVAGGGVMIDRGLRPGATPASGGLLEGLSAGQWQLLRAVSSGWSDQAIASQLDLSLSAVQDAITHLYRQLGIDATDRTRDARVEATRLLLRHGLNVP